MAAMSSGRPKAKGLPMRYGSLKKHHMLDTQDLAKQREMQRSAEFFAQKRSKKIHSERIMRGLTACM